MSRERDYADLRATWHGVREMVAMLAALPSPERRCGGPFETLGCGGHRLGVTARDRLAMTGIADAATHAGMTELARMCGTAVVYSDAPTTLLAVSAPKHDWGFGDLGGGGMQTYLANHWRAMWRWLGVDPDLGPLHFEWNHLLAAWREPHRRYHTLMHLRECLQLLDREIEGGRCEARLGAEIACALWFHDAVYRPIRSDNEERSAAWAERVLLASGVDLGARERIVALIMATCHGSNHAAEESVGGLGSSLCVDIDLAILGASEDRYRQFEGQVRAEYAWVPQWLFAQRRRAILSQFLAQEPLFRTPALRAEREAQARSNLRLGISLLASSR